jgi:hypothetical protein
VAHLITVDDLDADEAESVIRLGLRLHEHPGALAGVLDGHVVGLIEAPPHGLTAKVRLGAAAARLGATLVTLDEAPLEGDRIAEVPARLAAVRAGVVAVAGSSAGTVRSLGRHVAGPLFYAGDAPGDPWPSLAEAVACELAAARHARAAVDGIDELRREAMVPTAAAVLAVLTGAHRYPSVDLRESEPSHWFG